MILVIVTGFYAIQTYWLANVPFRSLLFARLAHKTSGTKSSIGVKIENVEIGAAVAVTCNYLIGSFNGDTTRRMSGADLLPIVSATMISTTSPSLSNISACPAFVIFCFSLGPNVASPLIIYANKSIQVFIMLVSAISN